MKKKILRQTDAGLIKFNNMTAIAGNTLAEVTGVKHSSIVRTVKRVMKYEENRKSGGTVGSLRIIHIEEEKAPNFNAVFQEYEYESRGKTYKTFLLNEDALYLVIANLKGQKAHNLKVQFKSEFNNMRMERAAREAVVSPTKRLNDLLHTLSAMLKEEIPKSKKAGFIYTHVQNAINKTVTGKGKGVNRETLGKHNLEEIDYLERLFIERVSERIVAGYTAEEMRNDVLALAKYLQKSEGN